MESERQTTAGATVPVPGRAQLRQLLGEIEHRSVETEDGVELSYQCFGPAAAPVVVFSNGIGVDFPGAAWQVAALRDRFRVVCWSYRGVGGSRVPASDIDLSMPRHAADALFVLDDLGVDRALFVGWSMGVQVNLEVWRRASERMAGFVALLGSYGQPFRTAFPEPLARALEGAFALLARHPLPAQAALDLAVTLPGLAFRLLSGALFVGRDADREVFDRNVTSVTCTDRQLYMRTMLELARHDASDVLPQLRCPALVIAATRDHLTPPSVARLMAERIPRAEYREIAGGTHFALIEQPRLVNGWVRGLADRVFEAPGPADGR